MIKEITNKFTSVFPLSEALAGWDNVGILINSTNENKKVLLTIDMTDKVIQECINKSIKNVICYHPIIFKPLKSINEDDLTYKCIKNGIAVFCPHTSLDKKMNEYFFNKICKHFNQTSEITFDSLACIGQLQENVSSIINAVKKVLNMGILRIAYPEKKDFIPKNVLVGVGAGFTYVDCKDSLVITGEMRHHELLYATKNGNAVILVEHSNGERLFMKELKRICDEILCGFDVSVSEEDKDPIEFI